jgi:hypothetical protein
MSFIQRELDRINAALHEPRFVDGTEEYRQLYAAQQALSWALDPEIFKAPYETIIGTLGDSEDCPSS